MRLAFSSMIACGVALIVSSAVGGEVAQKVKPECSKAHAVFFVSKSDQAEAGLARVKGLLEGSRKDRFEVVDGEPDGAHKIQLKSYNYKWGKDRMAVVGHCAHGGTCNDAAELVASKNAGTPSVFCGPLPIALE